MPLNFRDAVAMTRSLGFQYLWIDSLCILQDSREDWAREAVQMASIYKCARITLAATSARTCQDGFLDYAPASQRFKIPLEHPGTNVEGTRSLDENVPQEIVLQCASKNNGNYWARDVEDSVWNSRGWTLQERHLSRRIIHFAENQIFWECRKGFRSECGQQITMLPRSVAGACGLNESLIDDDQESSSTAEDSVSDSDRRSQNSSSAEAKSVSSVGSEEHVPELAASTLQPYTWWFSIIGDYTERRLTFPSDKSPALAGFVNEMLKFVEDSRFLAGIWVGALADCLLWRPADPLTTICVEPYRAPTWSWMRYDGPIIPTSERTNEDDLRDHIPSRDRITYVKHSSQHEHMQFSAKPTALSTLEARARIAEVSLTANSEREWNLDMHHLSSMQTIGLVVLDQEPKEGRRHDVNIYAMQVKQQVKRSLSWVSAGSQSGLVLQRVHHQSYEFERIGAYVLNEENLAFFDTVEPRLVTMG